MSNESFSSIYFVDKVPQPHFIEQTSILLRKLYFLHHSWPIILTFLARIDPFQSFQSLSNKNLMRTCKINDFILFLLMYLSDITDNRQRIGRAKVIFGHVFIRYFMIHDERIGDIKMIVCRYLRASIHDSTFLSKLSSDHEFTSRIAILGKLDVVVNKMGFFWNITGEAQYIAAQIQIVVRNIGYLLHLALENKTYLCIYQ